MSSPARNFPSSWPGRSLQPKPHPPRHGSPMNIHQKRTRGLSRFREVRERGNGSKMAALKEEQCYGLSCGRVSNGSNISVFHVKLTDSALRALEDYQSSKVTDTLLFLTITSTCCLLSLRKYCFLLQYLPAFIRANVSLASYTEWLWLSVSQLQAVSTRQVSADRRLMNNNSSLAALSRGRRLCGGSTGNLFTRI